MPFIAWVLVVWFALSGGVTAASLFSNEKEGTTPFTRALSALLTLALYAWLVWIVVRLATT